MISLEIYKPNKIFVMNIHILKYQIQFITDFLTCHGLLSPLVTMNPR